MGYLVTHIAAFLVFAQLSGLLLGWLLWGYVARQRARDLHSLREHLAGLQIASPRVALAGFKHASLNAPPEAVHTGVPEGEDSLPVRPPPRKLVEDDLSTAGAAPGAFFEFGADDPLVATARPVKDTLAAEVQESRLHYFEQRVRELESVRDRLPLLQADLSDALASRRAAESKLEEVRNDCEVRVSNLLAQIRNFELAAAEWDHTRTDQERLEIAREKELATVKAHLRDLQNNQLPQKAEGPGLSALEAADLRERYQKALHERDAIAAEWDEWKQGDAKRHANGKRVAELEEGIRSRDANLAEQAARVETLLWRVAELEPFAAAAPRLEQDLRRQESEIAGHVAMHAESSDHIRSLLNRIAELELEAAKIPDLQRQMAERQTELENQAKTNASALTQLHAALKQKDSEIVNQLARVVEREQALAASGAKLQGSISAHADLQREMQDWKRRVLELQQQAAKTAELEQAVKELGVEIQRLNGRVNDKDGQLTFMQEQLAKRTEHLEAAQQRVRLLEPLAEQLPEVRRQAVLQEERHKSDLTQLKVNSAHRIRRLRRGITNFKI
jgi:hypothetical protein